MGIDNKNGSSNEANADWKMPETNQEIQNNIHEKVHLRADIAPIRAQLEVHDSGNKELETIREHIEDGQEAGTIHWVDFDGGDLDELEANGFKQAGGNSYLISPISERDWFSDHYMSCTAVVAMGRDPKTGKELSFLTHQDPNFFVDGGDEEADQFAQALSESLKELKKLSEKDTVEVVLLGGNFDNKGKDVKDYYIHHQYEESIARLRQIVQETLGFDPVILAGPNTNVGSETVITVETQKRKVWVEQSKKTDDYKQPEES